MLRLFANPAVSGLCARVGQGAPTIRSHKYASHANWSAYGYRVGLSVVYRIGGLVNERESATQHPAIALTL